MTTILLLNQGLVDLQDRLSKEQVFSRDGCNNLLRGVALIREGDRSKFFGVIVSGSVEVSIEGKALCRLGPSEPVGEVAFLHPSSDMRCSTAVTLEPTLFLEINAAALALSSEELLERVRNVLLSRMIKRMREVNRIAAAQGLPAVQSLSASQVGGSNKPGGGLDLELAPM